MSHAEGEIAIRSFDEQVIVVIHEAVSMAKPVIAFIDVSKNPQKGLPVFVVFEYGFFVVAPIGDVIHRSGVFYAKWTGHERRLSEVLSKVKQYRPDPKMFMTPRCS